MMRKLIIAAAALLLGAVAFAQKQYSYTVDRIWSQGYASFPSIEKFNGAWYITFREGESHVFDKNGIAAGKIRILRSEDGVEWKSIALLEKEGFDLRDPKLSVTPDGKLMVMIGGSVYVEKKNVARVPHVSFSKDGKTFSNPQEALIDGKTSEDDWLWRVTWAGKTAYTVSYRKDHKTGYEHLMSSNDGVKWKSVSEIPVCGNETTLRMLPDGRMAALVRREGKGNTSCWCTSKAPYTEWEVKEMKSKVNGPDMIVLRDGRIIAGGRSLDSDAPKTKLWEVTPEGKLTELLVLPSGGDNSYPGFAQVGNELWVVYYSSHELRRDNGRPRAAIYLAKIPIDIL